ncbi:general substrate transporter [Lentinus tigrinus ALCF2SS1-7]|uniref:General substrate transporter n=1 Tax=Lentinus tigrinus ALCF2SS1-6 TaxID=1328759 RepID=A0A5C2SUC5_9APHY|nr:general substrate transporter [Lentinus tigrinus ALCF2SS1-6]RPD80608.1 general substrate transporter [Lentinus tigrinus ALCF2SS1-7]
MDSFADRFRPKSFPPRYPRWMVGRPLLITSSALAALGDAMFGYSQGAIAAVQLQPNFIDRFFGRNVTKEQIQMDATGVNPELLAITVACLNITAFIAAFGAAYVCDILGRRMSLRIGGFVYLISAILQIVAPDLACLIVGRSLQGVGVGILSMTVPIIQAEIAPGNHRGFFISIEYICLNLGYALSAWVGYAFYFAFPSDISWKGPYIVEVGMAVVLVLWSFIIPETPRFLMANGYLDEGLRVLADLHANGDVNDEGVRETYQGIVDTVNLENEMGQASWGQVFRQYTRRTVIGITCQTFAQFNGINAILYYLPENLLRAGFETEKALLYAAGSSLLYCVGTLPAMFGIDRLGRRPFLIVGSFGLAAALAVVGGLQFYVDSLPSGDARRPGANGIFAVLTPSTASRWGPGPWLLGAEIFPLRARAKGMALSTTANWISNFIIAFITPPLFASISGGYYFILLGFCIISGFFVFFVYPETAHKTLEELGSVFNDQTEEEKETLRQREESAQVSERKQSDASSDTTLRGSLDSEQKKSTEQAAQSSTE